MSDIHTIYLIHHSHTDIGYTQDQPIVWEMQSHFIDEAIALADKYADHDTDGAFRWTVETTGMLEYWLKYATDAEIEKLQQLEKSGHIEVTGMFANITPLYDADQIIESMQILRRLREDYGFTIEYAMNCDVNGQNWSLTDVLLDVGIKGFSMAINTHFGGALHPRPYTFNWEAPTGRSLFVNNGWTYDKAWREGIGRSAEEFKERWQILNAYLDEIGYPLPILMLQSFHPYGDNGSAYDFTPFLDEWNANNDLQIKMATPRMWWSVVEEYADQLETLRGDWTDYWNFGCISSAHEQRINRLSRAQLRNADSLYGALSQIKNSESRSWADKVFDRHREDAWFNLNFWDEHTWGADCAVTLPNNDDSRTQWNHKAQYAHLARSLSTLLQRDALGDLAQHISRENEDDIVVFNPLPFDRTVAGIVPYYVGNPRGVVTDTTAGRHHQDRKWVQQVRDHWSTGKQTVLPPTEVPAFGYKVVSRDELGLTSDKKWIGEDATVSNHRYVVTFDRESGGIISLYDKELDWELVNDSAEYGLNTYVHEEVADKSHFWARQMFTYQDWGTDLAEIPNGWNSGWHGKREASYEVLKHKVYEVSYGIMVEQELSAKGIDGVLKQVTFLPNYADFIEFSAEYVMTLNTHPEGTYLVFPFNVPDAVARYDVGGQAVVAGDEQLPGVCRDYFTVQGWVDFNNGERGITIATPENPMVQLGDFHFGHYQMEFNLEESTLLGWITNNYWETNFRAHQPGQVQARYRMQPYEGTFDESIAHRFGSAALQEESIFQHLGEPLIADNPLPAEGTLLNLPDEPVQVMRIKQATDGDGMIIRLINTSDEEQTATIGSNLLTITEVNLCDSLEVDGDVVDVNDGTIQVTLPKRAMVSVRCKF